MSQLIVNYFKLDGISSTARSIERQYDKRIDELESFKNKLRDVNNTGRSYLNQAEYEINQRISECEEKKQSIQRFSIKVRDFKEAALEIDKRVADKIEQNTNTFKSDNNLQTGIVGYIGLYIDHGCTENGLNKIVKHLSKNKIDLYEMGKDFARGLKQNIKDWYYDGGGKYAMEAFKSYMNLKISLAKVVVAGLTLNVKDFAIEGYDLLHSFSEFGFDLSAYYIYQKTGNRTVADEFSEMGLADAAGDLTSKLFANKEVGEAFGRGLVFAGDTVVFADAIASFKGISNFDIKNGLGNFSEVMGFNSENSLWGNLTSLDNYNSDELVELLENSIKFKTFASDSGFDMSLDTAGNLLILNDKSKIFEWGSKAKNVVDGVEGIKKSLES